MKASYLLYVEGVNISNVIDDTAQLSVRRGGSQLLRYGAVWINQFFSQNNKPIPLDGWEAISIGASKGLFYFETTPEQIDTFKTKVAELLVGQAKFTDNALYKEHGQALKHLTFVWQVLAIEAAVEMLKLNSSATEPGIYPPKTLSGKTFNSLKNLARSFTALQQFRQASIALPASQNQAAQWFDYPCAWDNLRPQSNKVVVRRSNGKPVEAKVSEATAQRFSFGRKMKTYLLYELLQQQYAVMGDLNSMAAAQWVPPQGKPSQLEGLGFNASKMAVFYADGNQFGKMFNACPSAQALQTVTEQLENQRRQFLKALCHNLSEHPSGHSYIDNHDNKTPAARQKALRLEVLLWGGDEIAIAVPAWFGLRAAALFYQHAQAQPVTLAGKAHHFNYAGGLVFCQANTPIARIEYIAKELAELVKQQKERNGVGYAVFESLDFPNKPIEHFIQQKFNTDTAAACLLSAEIFIAKNRLADNSARLISAIEAQSLAARQLHRLVDAIHTIASSQLSPQQKNQSFNDALTTLKGVIGPAAFDEIDTAARTLFKPLLQHNTNDNDTAFAPVNTTHWQHLVELKDYLRTYLLTPIPNQKELVHD